MSISGHPSPHSSTNHLNRSIGDVDSVNSSPLQPHRRTSRDSSVASSSAAKTRIFSVIDFAKHMSSNPSSRRHTANTADLTQQARNSPSNTSRNSPSNANIPTGKDYKSLDDYQRDHQIDMSNNNHKSSKSNSSHSNGDAAYSSYHSDEQPDHDPESLIDRVKEVIPPALGGEPNPNDPRQAFYNNDLEASKRAHEIRLQNLRDGVPLEENHGNIANEYLKSIVYGGLDGIITTFATVTSVAGAHFSALVVIVLGISHLFADGLSMGLGDALSSQAEIDYNKAERKRERWEMENNMDGEIEEMIAIYLKKGISKQDAQSMIHTLSKYPDAFLDHMMVEELSLMPPDPDDDPRKDGCITMASFMFFGSIPLTPYVMAHIPGFQKLLTDEIQLYSSIGLTVLTLFALGALKSTMVEQGRKWWKGGLQVAVTGTIAAVVGWAIGAILSSIVPEASEVVD